MAVHYPVTMTASLGVRVNKLVNVHDLLHEVTSDASHKVIEIIFTEISRDPEGHVTDALWVDADGLKCNKCEPDVSWGY